jgi:hypothetical protein
VCRELRNIHVPVQNTEELDHLGHKGSDGRMILVLILEAETQCEDMNWIQMGYDMVTMESFSEHRDEHEC